MVNPLFFATPGGEMSLSQFSQAFLLNFCLQDGKVMGWGLEPFASQGEAELMDLGRDHMVVVEVSEGSVDLVL